MCWGSIFYSILKRLYFYQPLLMFWVSMLRVMNDLTLVHVEGMRLKANRTCKWATLMICYISLYICIAYGRGAHLQTSEIQCSDWVHKIWWNWEFGLIRTIVCFKKSPLPIFFWFYIPVKDDYRLKIKNNFSYCQENLHWSYFKEKTHRKWVGDHASWKWN